MSRKLSTSRYVRPGCYIGQIIQPKAGNLTADARACNYVGRGSKYAIANNSGIRRSFIYDEELVLPKSAPFIHTLAYPANGVQDAPCMVIDSITGQELLPTDWKFQKVGSDFAQVLINPAVYNPSSVYKIDYQSTSRNVKDPLPVKELRFVKAVGNNQDRAQYKDLENFFIPFTFTGPFASSSNFVSTNFVTGVTADVNNLASGGSIQTHSDYSHDYTRFYDLEVVAINGVVAPFTATFKWTASRYSGGMHSAPPTPIHSSIASPTFTADETDIVSLTQDLEFGIKVDIAFGSQNFQVGDRFYFNAVGAGKVEFNSRYFNTNQYVAYSTIDSIPQVGSTGSFSFSATNNYVTPANMKYKMICISSSGTTPNRVAAFAYTTYGDEVGSSGTVAVNEGGSPVVLTAGIRLDANFGAINFQIGDEFSFEAKAPRMFYQAKDDRGIKLDIANIIITGADDATINLSYSTGTAEGGFGSVTAEMNLLSGINARYGLITLPDNVSLYLRNMIRGNINDASYATGDHFDCSVTSQEVMDWSLTSLAEEIRETTSYLTDITGSATGVVGAKYVTVSNVYTSGTITVVDSNTGAAVPFFEVAGTRYVAFSIAPTSTVRISYEYRGAEPNPGQLYYLSAQYKRPDTSYNKPTLILDKNEGRKFLAPAAVDNHLYIMNELAFANNPVGIYVTQPKDAAGNGYITDVDVQEALAAHETVSGITDLCLLSFFDSLSDSLAVNEKANDPFEKREQMLWVGAPIGTVVGDIDTEGSLVFLARRSLQTSPQSPAMGTRVLVAPTTCTMDLQLENGTVVEVTLDGSFVAGATSAFVNSFADPASTIIRKNLSGFKTIQVYSEPENNILGQASITYLSDQGSGVYRFEEDITVHDVDEEFQLINATTQKQFVTKVVRRQMDEALIGVVPPSATAAVSVIRSTLANILITLLGRGLIAQYRTASNTDRDFDAENDIDILLDETSNSTFYFGYSFYIKSVIKRLYGLYQVNQSNFKL